MFCRFRPRPTAVPGTDLVGVSYQKLISGEMTLARPSRQPSSNEETNGTLFVSRDPTSVEKAGKNGAVRVFLVNNITECGVMLIDVFVLFGFERHNPRLV